MRMSIVAMAATLALCAPSAADADARHAESGARIAMAVSAAMRSEKSIFAGDIAIYIAPDDRADALRDADLASFIMARSEGPNDSAVLLSSPDRTDLVAVHFVGDTPSFIVHMHGAAPNVAAIAAAIRPVDAAAVPQPDPKWTFVALPITADDGAALDSSMVGANTIP